MILIEMILIGFFVFLAILMMRTRRTAPDDAKADELTALKRRIRTLEQIVIDRDRNLRNEIDGLS